MLQKRLAKYISFKIWNDYSKSLIRCVRAHYPKDKFTIANKKKYKEYTTYYLKQIK